MSDLVRITNCWFSHAQAQFYGSDIYSAGMLHGFIHQGAEKLEKQLGFIEKTQHKLPFSAAINIVIIEKLNND